MKRILLVIRREYVEHVKTKSFIIGLLILPVMITASILIPNLLDRLSEKGKPVVVVDPGTGLGSDVVNAFRGGENYAISLQETDPLDLEAIVNDLSDGFGKRI